MEVAAPSLISIFQLGAALSIAFGAYFYLHDVNSAALNAHLDEIYEMSADPDVEANPIAEAAFSAIVLQITQLKRGKFIRGIDNFKPFVGYAAAVIYIYALIMLLIVSFSSIESKFGLYTIVPAILICVYPLAILMVSFVCEAKIKSVIATTRGEATEVIKAAQRAAIADEDEGVGPPGASA